MARLYTCYNSALINKERLAENTLRASIKGNSTSTPTSAAFCTPIYAPTSVPNLPDIYINIDLQRTTRLALKLFIKSQEQDQANSASQDGLFKP